MIGNPIRRDQKRIIWIDGGNHAREWPAFHTAAFFINKVLILLKNASLSFLIIGSTTINNDNNKY
ncbi:unnamed protein product [Brugia timori]|uniref:Peptidase_M14 domain-containing protein n=1 Tax=Brugia timori TaxID=42155 RepID=A0A0R3RCC8_9BILA|nr:unnamed protein product [Brugia timori]